MQINIIISYYILYYIILLKRSSDFYTWSQKEPNFHFVGWSNRCSGKQIWVENIHWISGRKLTPLIIGAPNYGNTRPHPFIIANNPCNPEMLFLALTRLFRSPSGMHPFSLVLIMVELKYTCGLDIKGTSSRIHSDTVFVKFNQTANTGTVG